jgi:4-amino-4-deoxy-L-arabinose transferase-like glycosyltransferase
MATNVEPGLAVAAGQARASLLSRRWPIIAVLALQAVVCIVALHNTAFQDEALYLYAGRQIIHQWNGGPVPAANYPSWFSGYPYVYPPIGGFLDMVGGLELARGFSLACMLGVTVMAYLVTGMLFGRRAAIFASAAYATTGVVLFVSRLATYDPMCLLLIATATALAVHGGMSKRPWAALAMGPAIVLAILAKYAALLFVLPLLCLLACVAVAFLGGRRGMSRFALGMASLAVSAGVAYAILDKTAFHAIAGTTTNRAVGFRAPRLGLLVHVLHMGGLIYLIAFGGLVLALRLQWRFRVIAVLMFGASWLTAAYHIYMQEPVSLDKHIAYGLFFAAPLAGYALAWLSGYGRRLSGTMRHDYWAAGAAALLLVLAFGLSQARYLYSGWANTSALSNVLQLQLRGGSGSILAEDEEVCSFDAPDVTQPWQWNTFYYIYYVDPAGHQLFGDAALTQAIKNRYYHWVELSLVALPQQAYYAAGQMAQTRNYDLIAAIPYSNAYGNGHYYLFRSAPVAGHGNFTSLAQLKTKNWAS